MGLDKLSSRKTAKKTIIQRDDMPKSLSTKDVVKLFNQESVLKPTIFGIDDSGEMEHNFPCPVCTNEPAVYEMIGDKHIFSPCKKCKDDGYTLTKKKKIWFWQ